MVPPGGPSLIGHTPETHYPSRGFAGSRLVPPGGPFFGARCFFFLSSVSGLFGSPWSRLCGDPSPYGLAVMTSLLPRLPSCCGWVACFPGWYSRGSPVRTLLMRITTNRAERGGGVHTYAVQPLDSRPPSAESITCAVGVFKSAGESPASYPIACSEAVPFLGANAPASFQTSCVTGWRRVLNPRLTCQWGQVTASMLRRAS